MAAETEEESAKNEEKETEYALPILYSRTFSTNASVPGCLVYSDDDQICLINNTSIYVFELQSTKHERSSELRFAVSVLANRSDEAPYDVGINPDMFCQQQNEFEESYSFSLDISLNPNRVNAIPSGYSSAKWSPLNCSPSGSSLLATVTVNGNIHINNLEQYTGEWKEVADLTGVLHKQFRSNGYQETCVDKPENTKKKTKTELLSEEFALYRRRQYYLSTTGICWCPVTLEIFNPMLERGLVCGERRFKNILLASCNKLGWIFIWRLRVDLVEDRIESYMEHTIKTGCEFATKITWYQDASSSKGYIAVAYSNGFIKVCTLEISKKNESFCYENVQIYDLWSTKDLMACKFMEFIKKGNHLILVVTKMTDVLLFALKMKEDGEIVEYLYELGPTQHHLPITALSCHGETIATAGMDGITQYFQVGEKSSRACKVTCKKGYSCMGMQLSPNGLMMVQILCPTSIVYMQSHQRFNKPLELIVFPRLSLEDATKMFTDPKQALNLEICEFLRTISHHQDVPVSLKEFHSLEVNCGCSLNKLQKMEFLDELVRSNEKGKESTEEGRKKSRPSLLREKLCRDQLEAALKAISCGKEMDRTGKEYLLLAADWLVMNGRTKSSFELATSAYTSLSDPCSSDKAIELWERREKDSELPQKSVQAKEGEMIDSVGMPPRERCPVCKGDIPLDNDTFGECKKLHHWKRCSLTLGLLSDDLNRICTGCGKHAQCKIFDTEGQGEHHTLNSVNVDNCYFCNGRLKVFC